MLMHNLQTVIVNYDDNNWLNSSKNYSTSFITARVNVSMHFTFPREEASFVAGVHCFASKQVNEYSNQFSVS